MQFLVCLTLTFIAFVIQDALTTLRGYETIDQIFGLASLFHNPYIAIVHLSTPYLFMLALDIRSRQKHKKIKKYEEKQKEGLLDNDDS